MSSTVHQEIHGRQFFFVLVPLERFLGDLQNMVAVVVHIERHSLYGRWVVRESGQLHTD